MSNYFFCNEEYINLSLVFFLIKWFLGFYYTVKVIVLCLHYPSILFISLKTKLPLESFEKTKPVWWTTIAGPYKSNRLGQHRQDILYRKKCVFFLFIVWSNTYGTDTIEATLETKRTRTDCSSVCETYWLLIFLYMYMYKGFNKRMNKKYIQKVFLKNIMRSAHSFLFFYQINNQNRTRFFQCN